jgi:hypothetical protein
MSSSLITSFVEVAMPMYDESKDPKLQGPFMSGSNEPPKEPLWKRILRIGLWTVVCLFLLIEVSIILYCFYISFR